MRRFHFWTRINTHPIFVKIYTNKLQSIMKIIKKISLIVILKTTNSRYNYTKWNLTFNTKVDFSIFRENWTQTTTWWNNSKVIRSRSLWATFEELIDLRELRLSITDLNQILCMEMKMQSARISSKRSRLRCKLGIWIE